MNNLQGNNNNNMDNAGGLSSGSLNVQVLTKSISKRLRKFSAAHSRNRSLDNEFSVRKSKSDPKINLNNSNSLSPRKRKYTGNNDDNEPEGSQLATPQSTFLVAGSAIDGTVTDDDKNDTRNNGVITKSASLTHVSMMINDVFNTEKERLTIRRPRDESTMMIDIIKKNEYLGLDILNAFLTIYIKFIRRDHAPFEINIADHTRFNISK